ncbi:MAG: ImmA/IrrE family metallo-endopeptidase [Methylobacter sp.]|nr:ImmA/IrrE family metallo-endopeptidase [Methylobacter sp.]
MTPSEAEAEQLIEDLGLSLPIIPKEVCEQISTDDLLVEYSEKSFQTLDICGFSIGHGNRIKVVVNSKINNSGRMNFTGAHEIGHVILHIQKNIASEFNCTTEDVYGKNIANKSYEREANEFASSLLMPKVLIGKSVARNDLTWDLIHQLSIECGSSLEATARRVINLSKEKCALVIHKNGSMWTPIRSSSFNGFIDPIQFPKHLRSYPDVQNLDYPNYLEECDSVDWFRNPRNIPDMIQYLSIHNAEYDRRMTLLVIPEEDTDDEEDEWKEPSF